MLKNMNLTKKEKGITRPKNDGNINVADENVKITFEILAESLS